MAPANHSTCRSTSSKLRRKQYNSEIENPIIQPAGNDWAGYPELQRILSRKAAAMGDREPEDVVGEAIKRALQHPQAGFALRAYLSGDTRPAEWSRGRLTAFLLVTVHHIVSERWRAAGRRPEVPLKSPESEDGRGIDPPALSKNPLEKVLAHEIELLLAGGLSRLSEISRLVLLLFYSGKSHFEIAEITGCKIGTVGARITRARHALRAFLSGPLSRLEKEEK